MAYLQDTFGDYKILSETDLEEIHDAVLDILQDPGIRVINKKLLDACKKSGAKVDEENFIVRFPRSLVEQTIEMMKGDSNKDYKAPILCGAMSSWSKGKIAGKFAGACIEYLDWEKKEIREPTINDMITMVRLGDALDEIEYNGNAIIAMWQENGERIDPRLERIRTAEIIAKNTSKPATTEVWNTVELEYLVEMGVMIAGGWEEYRRRPLFITGQAVIAPLTLPPDHAEILCKLSLMGLPCTIVTMPLTGVSSPVMPASNVAVGVAEVLGVATALKAFNPDTFCNGGSISGVLDMSEGTACLSTPEAALQDIAMAEFWKRYYGLDFGIGTGNIDAKYPGVQAAIEKALKVFTAALAGRVNYSVGMLYAGKTFSPEQAIIDIEISNMILAYFKGIDCSRDSFCVDLIRKVGIGGNFISEEHTARNYRKQLWFPKLMERSFSKGPGLIGSDDIVDKANLYWKNILELHKPYELPANVYAELDSIVEKAERTILGKVKAL